MVFEHLKDQIEWVDPVGDEVCSKCQGPVTFETWAPHQKAVPKVQGSFICSPCYQKWLYDTWCHGCFREIPLGSITFKIEIAVKSTEYTMPGGNRGFSGPGRGPWKYVFCCLPCAARFLQNLEIKDSMDHDYPWTAPAPGSRPS